MGALVPVGSLLICETSLRQMVPDDNRRWMISGAVAVALVNLLIFAYVAWCFCEGFQHEWGARPASAAGATVKESSSRESGEPENADTDAASASAEEKKDR